MEKLSAETTEETQSQHTQKSRDHSPSLDIKKCGINILFILIFSQTKDYMSCHNNYKGMKMVCEDEI